MRTIVGNSTKKTKEVKTQRIVELDPNNLPAPTNVSQYGAAGSELKDLETAKFWAKDAEQSAKEAKASETNAEIFMNLAIKASEEVSDNTQDSLDYLTEIRQISTKIDGQEINITELEGSTVTNARIADVAAQAAADFAGAARQSEANSTASASSANNSAISAKESETNAKISEVSAADSATKAGQKLAQTEAVYDKTIDDVSTAVQSYLKDKGGFDPDLGLPKPDTWFDIFGVEKKLSCLWVSEKAGTVEGVGFNEGDVLIYNANVDRYGRFSGELVTGGGGGGPTEFFNDLLLARGKRVLGTDSVGSQVELIKFSEAEGVVEAGDKTKPLHLLSRDSDSAFVCVANAASPTGFDNYEIYHSGNKPTPADLNIYSKAESDSKFVDVTGDEMSGNLSTTGTVIVKGQEVYHPANKPTTAALGAVSITASETVTGQKKFTQNPIVESANPAVTLSETDENTQVNIALQAKKVTIGTNTATPIELDTATNSVSMNNPSVKTAQGTASNSVTRKDYVDAELAKKVDKTGGSIGGDLIVTGKLTVEGTGSLLKDINTTGHIKENNIRVYSPANKPNAVDVGALPISGGSIGGAVHVVGNITTDGTISEKGQRVYSPNNKPTPADIGASVAADEWRLKSKGIGSSSVETDLDTVIDIGWYHSSSAANLFVNKPSDCPGAFTLFVDSIGPSQNVYRRQVVYAYNSSRFWTREKVTAGWNPWARNYDTQNKPTAADVGAIGIDNVYDKTQADARFWQRTETVNRSFSSDATNSYAKSASDFKDVTNLRSYGVFSSANSGFPNVYGSGIFQGRTAGVENHGWSLFHQANSTNLSLGKQKLDGSGFDWYRIYHEGFKPSAGDVGTYTKSEIDNKDALKLNLTGGTVTGSTTFTSTVNINNQNLIVGGINLIGSDSSVLRIGDTTRSRYIRLECSYLTVRNGPSSDHKVYHEGFKPTAVDVNALPITGGTLTGALNGTLLNMSGAITSNTSLNVRAADPVVTFSDGTLSGCIGLRSSDGLFVRLPGDDTTRYKIHHTGNLQFSKTPTADKLVQRDSNGGINALGLYGYHNSVGVYHNPIGGNYSISNVSYTGSIKIALPKWKSTAMIKMHVSVFNYTDGTSFDAYISGYDYESGWVRCSAVIIGGSGTTNHPVYFGHEGSKACIWIGSVGQVWSYPKIAINSVQVGHGSADSGWNAGYAISVVTALGTINHTISDTILKPGGDKTASDEQPTPNTIVKRNAYGEISAKGRVLISSTDDNDVNTGTARVDFVTAAGSVFGQIGDISTGTGNMTVRSDTPFEVRFLNNGAQKILTGGLLASSSYADVSKVPNNGIYATGDINTTGGLTVGGAFNVQTNKFYMSGVEMMGAAPDTTRFGDAGFARPLNLNASNGEAYVQTSSSVKHRIYHAGFKPTASDVGAVSKSGDKMTGALEISYNNAAVLTLKALNGGATPAETARIKLIGYGARAEGIYFSDENTTLGTWFTGIPYSGSHGRYVIGFSSNNTQSEYMANAKFSVLSNGDLLAGTNKIYHQGFKPTLSELGTYSTTEIDNKLNLKFDKTGGSLSGNVMLSGDTSYFKVGGTSGGFSGFFGSKRQKKVSGTSTLDYGTYWSYDSYVDDSGDWRAARTTLTGGKLVADMGHHTQSFRVRRYTGDPAVVWGDTDWSTLFEVSSTQLTYLGNSIYHTANKPTASDIGTYTKAEIDNKDATKLNLSGGTLTGETFIKSTDWRRLGVIRTFSGTDVTSSLAVGSDESAGLFREKTGQTGSSIRLVSPSLTGLKFFLGTDAYNVYHAGNKPTAADVGALPITGGILTGTTRVTASSGESQIGVKVGVRDTYLYDSGGTVGVYSKLGGTGATADAHLVYRNIASGVIYLGHPSIPTALLGSSVTVGGTADKVYHQGFKPTAADVGAYTRSEVDTKVNAKLNLSGGTLTGALKFPMLNNLSVSDLNKVGDDSGFSFNYSTSSATGKPAGTDHAVITHAYSNVWKTQLASDWRTNKWYVRSCENGTWKSWAEVYTTAFKPTASELGAVNKAGDTMTGPLLVNHAATNTAPSANVVKYDGYGIIGNRATIYVTNGSASGSLVLGVGGVHGSTTSKLTIEPSKISSSGQLFEAGNRVYSAANKPTAVDVGAEPLMDKKTISKTLDLSTTWVDTGITSADLVTGTYVINITTTNTTNGFYYETFAGIMQMYSGGTNQTGASEIVLTNCGHADGGHFIYAQVLRTLNSDGKVKLQIKCSRTAAAQGLNFTFKRLL